MPFLVRASMLSLGRVASNGAIYMAAEAPGPARPRSGATYLATALVFIAALYRRHIARAATLISSPAPRLCR